MIQLNNKQFSSHNKAFFYIIGFYSVFTLFTILKNTYTYNDYSLSTNLISSNLEVYLIKYLLVVVFISLILFCCKAMFVRKLSWFKTAVFHVFLAISFGIYLYLGMVIFENPLISNYQFSLNSFTDYYINTIDYNFLIYFSFIAIIYSLLYVEKVKKTERASVLLSNDLENSRLKVLQSQIHPNFLFNGLNTISSLMKTNVQLAQNTTVNLGEYLREVLIYKDQKFISVKDDLQLINKYIDIMRTRYRDQLTVNIEIHKNVETCYIPMMLLQPIIESFIKNGFKYNEDDNLDIQIDLINIDKKTNITISSNCKKCNKKELSIKPIEEGILNLETRLQLLFPNEHSLSIKSLNNRPGVQAKIVFPCKSKEEIQESSISSF